MTSPAQIFQGKVAVVTGGNGGIGREIALLLGERGASVVVNDLCSASDGDGRSSARAEETAKMIAKAGGKAAVSIESVSTWASAQRIIETALDQFGRIDIVINNAGILRWAPFWEMPPEDFEAVLDAHLSGSFFVSRAAALYFMAQRGSAFVHMTSASGLMGVPNQAYYCAAKAGIVGLSRDITLDMKHFGVRSNCMAPFAYTRMAREIPEGDLMTPLVLLNYDSTGIGRQSGRFRGTIQPQRHRDQFLLQILLDVPLARRLDSAVRGHGPRHRAFPPSTNRSRYRRHPGP